MNARRRDAAVRRPSLPLNERDERDLAALRSSDVHLQALEQLSGENVALGTVSEAALLHAVFKAGLAAVREAAEDVGYAHLAAQRADGAEVARAVARRRKPEWANEA